MTTMATLQPLVGRWSTTIKMVSPADVAGEIYRAIDTYRWMPGERVLLHEVEARMGGEPINSLEIYSEAEGQIVSRNFDASGVVSDYKGEMEGGVWRVESKTERFASTFLGADLIEGLWQQKSDQGWIDWMTVRLDRIA